MMYPQRNTAAGFIPYRFSGPPVPTAGAPINRRCMFTVLPKTAAIPDGYSASGALVMPYTAGGLSSWQAVISTTGAGDVIAGGPMIGDGAFGFTGAAGLSMIITMSGDGAMTVTGAGGMALTIALDGDGAISITGAAGLSMIVPIDGSGTFGIDGAGDVRGLLTMDGSWTPFTTLSPETLAQAVWAAMVDGNSDPDTMGEALAKALRAAKLAATLSA